MYSLQVFHLPLQFVSVAEPKSTKSHVVVRMDTFTCTPNVGFSQSKDKDNRGSQDVIKAIKYLFAEGNKRSSLVFSI